MDFIKFINLNNTLSVRLTISHTCVTQRIHNDELFGWDKDTVTVGYLLSPSKFKLYEKYGKEIDSILITHGLTQEPQIKLIKSSLLFYAIEFDRILAGLINDRAVYARVDNMIEFLKYTMPLSPAEQQKIQVSFLIKNQPFNLKDQLVLTGEVVDKLTDLITEAVSNGYPELWNFYFKDNKPLNKRRADAESTLRNIAVAETTKRIILYLNENSVKLCNKRAKSDKVSITSKQGNFIYDLLKQLDIYKPTQKGQEDTGSKLAYYHGLRKLLERYP